MASTIFSGGQGFGGPTSEWPEFGRDGRMKRERRGISLVAGAVASAAVAGDCFVYFRHCFCWRPTPSEQRAAII